MIYCIYVSYKLISILCLSLFHFYTALHTIHNVIFSLLFEKQQIKYKRRVKKPCGIPFLQAFIHVVWFLSEKEEDLETFCIVVVNTAQSSKQNRKRTTN